MPPSCRGEEAIGSQAVPLVTGFVDWTTSASVLCGPPTCRELTMLAQRLASLAPALAAAVTADPRHVSAPLAQITTARLAVDACHRLASALGLQGSDALRVAAAARVPVVAGRPALAAAAAQVAALEPTGLAVTDLRTLAGVQLTAMQGLMALMSSPAHPNAALAFASSTVAPRAFMPWLLAATSALSQCYRPQQGAHGRELGVLLWCTTWSILYILEAQAVCPAGGTPSEMAPLALTSLASLVHALVNPAALAYSAHREALAGSSAIQSAVVSSLLEHVLPGLVATVEGRDMDWSTGGTTPLQDSLIAALIAPSLAPAVRSRLHQPDGAAFLRQAVRVFGAVPLRHGEGLPAEVIMQAHASAIKLLAPLYHALVINEVAAGAAGASQDSAGGQGNAGRAPVAGGGSNRAAAVCTADLQGAACWEMIGLVPHLAAVLDWLGRLPAGSTGLQQVQAFYCTAFTMLLSWRDELGSFSSQQQLRAWAAAADAGLRLLPLLCHWQLDASWQQLDVRTVQQAPAGTVASSILGLWRDGCITAWSWADGSGSMASAEERASVAGQLAQLQSRSCRLLHWLAAAPDDCAVLPGRGSKEGCTDLQENLSLLFCVIDALEGEGADPDPSQAAADRWAEAGRAWQYMAALQGKPGTVLHPASGYWWRLQCSCQHM